MAQNCIACDREQELWLPPSLREWLPEGHLAWFVLDAVSELDLAAFHAGYRDDGWGRAAHDPAMMVPLFVYAYAIGVRSSRAIGDRRPPRRRPPPGARRSRAPRSLGEHGARPTRADPGRRRRLRDARRTPPAASVGACVSPSRRGRS